MNAIKPGSMKDVKILGTKPGAAAEGKPKKDGSTIDLKRMSDNERTTVRKREHKALMKSLTLAQMSTASMGRFDRKAGKNEKAAPTS